MKSSRYSYTKASKIKQFTSWSYSRYRDYKRCPYFAKLKHLDKVPEGSTVNPAMIRGSAIGAMAEDYTKGILKRLPSELSMFAKQFTALAKMKMKNVWVEESWCFDKDWKPILHKFPLDKNGEMMWDKFAPADCDAWRSIWVRVKMDLCGIDEQTNVLVPVDHKTGKYREYELASYLEQLEIYAIGGMCRFEQVAGASPRLWFLDEGLEYPQGVGEEFYYAREELPALIKKWACNVAPMFSDTTFRPRPNDKCKYCAYSSAKGGTCKY
jgi:hypothetical protein